MVSLAQELDVLDVRRNFVGRQRCHRIGLGEAVEAELLGVYLAPEIGVVAFPAAQVLDDSRLRSAARPQPVEPGSLRTFVQHPVYFLKKFLRVHKRMVRPVGKSHPMNGLEGGVSDIPHWERAAAATDRPMKLTGQVSAISV